MKKPEPNVDSRNQFSTVSGTIYHSEKQVTKGKRSTSPAQGFETYNLEKSSLDKAFQRTCLEFASGSAPCPDHGGVAVFHVGSQQEVARSQARGKENQTRQIRFVSNTAVPPLRRSPRKRACHRSSYLFNSRVSGPMLADRTQGRGLGRQRFGRSLSRKSQCR